MPAMSVTLEVSKLSGWLNADADCRDSNGGHTVRREVQRTGWPEAAGDRGVTSVGSAVLGQAQGGARPKHLVHGCDAGGVEAQRLVER